MWLSLVFGAACALLAPAHAVSPEPCVPKPTPIAGTPPQSLCNAVGTLKKASLLNQFQSSTGNYKACYQACYGAKKCKSFSYNKKTKQCQIYGQPLARQGFTASKSSINFWNIQNCFSAPACPVPSPSPTSTPTSSGSSVATPTTSTSSVSTSTPTATPTATFGPDLPSTWSACAYDLNDAAASYQLLEGSIGLPLVSDNGAVALANKVDTSLPVFQFSAPADRTQNVFDLVYSDASSGTLSFLAVFDTGEVGFVNNSSNGQHFVTETLGSRKYITSIFSATCDGVLAQGIVNSSPIKFGLKGQQLVVSDGLSAVPRLQRRDSVISAVDLVLFRSYDGYLSDQSDTVVSLTRRASPYPDQPRCQSPNQEPTLKPGARPAGTNGCGPDLARRHADFDFGTCCDHHDYCYDGEVLNSDGSVQSDNCQSTFNDCNDNFATCNSDTCNSVYPASNDAHDLSNALNRWGCQLLGREYVWVVRSPIGRKFFDDATADRCQCKCKYPNQPNCGCDSSNYAASPLFHQPHDWWSDGWNECKGCCGEWITSIFGGPVCTCCMFGWQYADPANGCCPPEVSDACCRIGCGS